MQDENPAAKRRHERSDFAFPVELKLFTQNSDCATFTGFVQDMSISGAHIRFEDKYGRMDVTNLKGINIKIKIIVPEGENLSIPCCIRWVTKDHANKFAINVGVEFTHITDLHLTAIKDLINRKNKDRNMMWTLWEQYEKQI